MNSQILTGNWRQLKGLALEKWGRITDDDFMVLEGRQEYWAGEMMEARGIAIDESQRRVRRPAL
jgi:uncharacterized protein YjbJ (UPF0337 family)